MVTRLRLAVAVAVLVLAAACAEDDVSMIPSPPPTQPRPSTTALPDFSGQELAAVAGRTTTTAVPLTGGGATLKGTVRGPDGLVPGATVVLERLVGDAVASGSVPTASDGAYLAPGIQGGRYRVRAFRSPDLAQVQPVILFLGGTEQKALELKVDRYDGIAVQASVAPNPPPFGERASLVVLVTDRSVDATGVVTATPVPGTTAELFGAGSWRVESANPTTTDAGGRARWVLRCTQTGRQPLSVVVGTNDALPLDLPPCTVAQAEAPAGDSTTSTSAATTSTTRPRS